VVTDWIFLPVQSAEERYLRRVVIAVGVEMLLRQKKKRWIFQSVFPAVMETVLGQLMNRKFAIFVGNLTVASRLNVRIQKTHSA
jgi:hypothetical protein